MNSCFFLGHRDTSSGISTQLEQTVFSLITNEKVSIFYTGHQGFLIITPHKPYKKPKQYTRKFVYFWFCPITLRSTRRLFLPATTVAIIPSDNLFHRNTLLPGLTGKSFMSVLFSSPMFTRLVMLKSCWNMLNDAKSAVYCASYICKTCILRLTTYSSPAILNLPQKEAEYL